MKLRTDFVTNSSSSSFIISKDDIAKDKLINILLEILTLDRKWYEDEDGYEEPTRETELRDGDGEFYVSWHYHVTEGTKENPIDDYGKKYDNHYLIDNDGNVRYDWDNVDDVLSKYGIAYQLGYCD